ncbi:hypothetical protein AALO_G00093510 [Alosa alosa]|uniref:RING-type domain-containing protein n=1 Tax=Alosa alosa TaxID=278164 RepID=A0AAV6GS43_9TELE|nr:hypothetical protein AALO_G00093510 [Alosa alosa]
MLPSTGHSELRSDLTQDQSRWGVCEQVLRDPVITTCGHSVCRQCIGSYWEQSPDQPRPLCGSSVLNTSQTRQREMKPSLAVTSDVKDKRKPNPGQRGSVNLWWNVCRWVSVPEETL